MHQSIETLGGWPGAFTFYASESKWILASENGILLRPHMSHTVLPFLKKQKN